MTFRQEVRALCAETEAALRTKRAATQERLANDRARAAAVLALVRRENQELASWQAREKASPPGAECGEPRASSGGWTSAGLERALARTSEIKAPQRRRKSPSQKPWAEAYRFSTRKMAGLAENRGLSIEHLQRELRKDRMNAGILCDLGLRYWDIERLQDATGWFARAAACVEAKPDDYAPGVVLSCLHMSFEAHLALGLERRESLARSENFATASRAMACWLNTRGWGPESLEEADETLHLIEEALRPHLLSDQEHILRSGSLGPLGDLHIRVLYARLDQGGATENESRRRLGELLAERKDFAEACAVLHEASTADDVKHPRVPAADLRTYAPWNKISHAYDRFDAVPAHRDRRRRTEKHEARIALCAAQGTADRARKEREFARGGRRRAIASGVRAHHGLASIDKGLEPNSEVVELCRVGREMLGDAEARVCEEALEAQAMLDAEVDTLESKLALAQEHEKPGLSTPSFP